MTNAERKWILRQFAKLRKDCREDTQRALTDILTEEIRLIFLERMTKRPEVTVE